MNKIRQILLICIKKPATIILAPLYSGLIFIAAALDWQHVEVMSSNDFRARNSDNHNKQREVHDQQKRIVIKTRNLYQRSLYSKGAHANYLNYLWANKVPELKLVQSRYFPKMESTTVTMLLSGGIRIASLETGISYSSKMPAVLSYYFSTRGIATH